MFEGNHNKPLNSDSEQLANREKLAVSLMEGLGFEVIERKEELIGEGNIDEYEKKDGTINLEEVELDPMGFYAVGKYVAAQEVNGHTVRVVFTPQKAKDFDARVLVDDESIGANHDFSEGELLGYIKNAMAVATFGVELGKLPTWTPEYQQFEADFKARVEEAKANQAV